MRNLLVGVALAGVLSCGALVNGQAISDFGAVAAGSAVGGAAGKPMSDALTNILGNVEKAAGTAAEAVTKDLTKEVTKDAPLAVAPGQSTQELERVNARPALNLPAVSRARAEKLPSYRALNGGSAISKLAPKPVEDKPLSPEEQAKVFASAPVIDSLFELPVLPESVRRQGSVADAIPTPAPLPPPVMTAASFKNVSSGMSRGELLRMGPPAFKVTMDEDGHLVELFTYNESGQRLGSVKLSDGAVASVRR